MNKTNLLLLSGISMFLGGLSILFSQNIGISISKIATPILFIISGVLAIQFANANKIHSLAKNYHLLQGLGMISFAIAIIFLPTSLESFLTIITFFTMVYGILELIFSFSVLNTNHKLKMNMLVVRIISGAFNLIGGFILFMTLLNNIETGLTIAGILIILGGISFSVFSLKIKK
ncbi:hypothetical protein [uncultured Tenacibaculum sp.]|uniref:hypothetical protein n=1 Tax=uncultured Tenacibaculum sp. TaxID=174713 RepID=UPI00262DB1DA|nr:hypothetical protein [uncultured Tenacibaculum sp.]